MLFRSHDMNHFSLSKMLIRYLEYLLIYYVVIQDREVFDASQKGILLVAYHWGCVLLPPQLIFEISDKFAYPVETGSAVQAVEHNQSLVKRVKFRLGEIPLVDGEILIFVAVITSMAFVKALDRGAPTFLALHEGNVIEYSTSLDVVFDVVNSILFRQVEFLESLVTRLNEVLNKKPLIPIGETGIKGLIPDHGMFVSCHSIYFCESDCSTHKNTKLLTIRQEIMQEMCTIITLPLILLFYTSQSDDL